MAPHFVRLILITRRPQRSSFPREVAGSRKDAKVRSVVVAGRSCTLVYNALHRYYRYYPYYTYYEYYTDVRATSKEQAWHDGSFFLRFPPRASFSLFLRPHLLSATSSSFPACTASLHPSLQSFFSIASATHPLLSLTYSLSYLFCYLFTLRAESERAV